MISFMLSAFLFWEASFYALYFIGSLFSGAITMVAVKKNIRKLPKPLLLIVYFIFMHASAVAGWVKFAGKRQSVNWERAVRLSGAP